MRLSTLTLAALCACGAPPETDLETVFCDILQNGPEEDFSAGQSAADAPEVFVDGVNVELALNEGPDGFTGFATFTPDEAGSYAFGFKEDLPWTVTDPNGNVVGIDAEVQGGSCPDLAVRYTLTLDAAAHVVSFGPAEVPEADFVAEESDDDL